MRWVARTLALALVLAAGAGAAQQASPPNSGKRIALVIGNADYNLDGRVDPSPEGLAQSAVGGFAPDLANVPNDAADMRDVLVQLGYDVDFIENADLARLQAGARGLLDRAAEWPDAKVIVYYAGHGVKVDGLSYIIPVGVPTPSSLPLYSGNITLGPDRRVAAAMRNLTFPVNELLAGLSARVGDGFGLVMIDSCGNNPWYKFNAANFTPSEILHGFMEDEYRDVPMVADVVAAFAAGSGEARDGLGRNSPFVTTTKLHIADASLPVGALLAVTTSEVIRLTGGDQTPLLLQGGRKGTQAFIDIGRRCVATCGGP